MVSLGAIALGLFGGGIYYWCRGKRRDAKRAKDNVASSQDLERPSTPADETDEKQQQRQTANSDDFKRTFTKVEKPEKREDSASSTAATERTDPESTAEAEPWTIPIVGTFYNSVLWLVGADSTNGTDNQS